MVGITERGDPVFDTSWISRIGDKDIDYAILISKSIPDIPTMLKHKDKIIFHATTTGMGGTLIERGVKSTAERFEDLEKLCVAGFPREQIVIRVDPIISTSKGVKTAINVMNMAISLGYRRIRFSLVNPYPHVIERMRRCSDNVCTIFTTEIDHRKAYDEIKKLSKQYPEVSFESCAMDDEFKTACISSKDAEILHLSQDIIDKLYTGSSKQRSKCLCPSTKIDLLKSPRQCKHSCLYCYWKEDYIEKE